MANRPKGSTATRYTWTSRTSTTRRPPSSNPRRRMKKPTCYQRRLLQKQRRLQPPTARTSGPHRFRHSRHLKHSKRKPKQHSSHRSQPQDVSQTQQTPARAQSSRRTSKQEPLRWNQRPAKAPRRIRIKVLQVYHRSRLTSIWTTTRHRAWKATWVRLRPRKRPCLSRAEKAELVLGGGRMRPSRVLDSQSHSSRRALEQKTKARG